MKIKNFLSEIKRKQCAETGQVATLIVLFLAVCFHDERYVITGFFALLITLVIPTILYPFAAIWFGLSYVMNLVSSKILMTMVFVFLVVPVGMVRKLFKKDPLKINQFKKSRASVMIERNHEFTGADLLNTF